MSKIREEQRYEPQCEKRNLLTCASNEDTKPVHPCSMISLHCQHEETLHIGYPKCTQWRVWSDCWNVQADLNLSCKCHSKKCFLTLWHIWELKCMSCNARTCIFGYVHPVLTQLSPNIHAFWLVFAEHSLDSQGSLSMLVKIAADNILNFFFFPRKQALTFHANYCISKSA